jgi:hypothetical protein
VACTRKGTNLGVSGSDDGDIKIWDPRVRGAVQTLPESYQVANDMIRESVCAERERYVYSHTHMRAHTHSLTYSSMHMYNVCT